MFLCALLSCFRYLGPGGIGDYSEYVHCTGGASGYVDQQVLGTSHVYTGPTCGSLYDCQAYDPEGILGCLTSIVLTFLGVQAGRIIKYFPDHRARVVRWVLWGVGLASLALLLCGAKQNGGWIPINKNLWSLSYILAQAGTGMLMLCLCYVLVDILHVWSGAPFIFLGMNSIATYCLHEFLASRFPLALPPDDPDALTHGYMLKTELIALALIIVVAYAMHRNKIYVKI